MHKHLMVGVFVPLGGLDGIVKDQHPAEQPAGGDLDALKRGPSIVQNCVYLHGLGHPRSDEIDDPLHADTPSLRNHGTRYQGTKQTNPQFSIWPGSLVPWYLGSALPALQGQNTTAAIAQPIRCTTCSFTATRISSGGRSRTASASSTILRTIVSAFSPVPVCSYSMITPQFP